MTSVNELDVGGVALGFELGPLFVAHCFNWGLYGLLCLQVYLYYCSFPKDVPHFKAIVYISFILDTVSIALATYSGYVVFVKNWGQTSVFHHLGWSWATVPASSGLMALIAQAFFAYRIWKMSKNWWLPTFIVLLSAVACGFAFASAAEVGRLQTFTYIRHLTPSIWLSFGISADFFVCATLVFYLIRSKTGWKQSDRIIVRIVRITIETAAVTIIAAAIKLYLIFSRRDNMHLLFCLLLARLYSNALLATLNSRSTKLFGSRTTTTDSFNCATSSSFMNSPSRQWNNNLGPSLGTISIGNKKFRGADIEIGPRTGSTLQLECGNEDEEILDVFPSVPVYPLSPRAPTYSSTSLQSPPLIAFSPPSSAPHNKRTFH